MSETLSSPDQAPAAPRWSRQYRALGTEIESRVAKLQSGYLRDDSGSVAGLAKLRRGIGKPVGDLPEIWEYTFIERDDAPPGRLTEAENAAYGAMTLYSLHQQGKRTPSSGSAPGDRMHWQGVSVGHACRDYENAGKDPDDNTARGTQIRQRLNAALTSTSPAGTLHYLRALVELLRRDSIPLDYGMLADDLCDLQDPRTASAVKRRWARDVYSSARRQPKSTDESTTPEEN